jgi:hypothetical protein
MPLASEGPIVPQEVKGWNWGAFLLTWIWGIFNGTFVSLLVLVPFGNIVMPFVLGAMGNEWAWKNKTWQSIEQFHAVQRRWAMAGLILDGVFIALAVTGLIAFLTAIKSDTLFVAGLKEVQHNPKAIQVLGEPIHHGFGFMGSLESSGPTGKADIAMPVEGSKNKGTIYIKAEKQAGQWHTKVLQLAVDGQDQRIDLEPPGFELKI